MAGQSRLQSRLPVLDHRAQADERQAIPDLPDLPRAIHGVVRSRCMCCTGISAPWVRAAALSMTNILALTVTWYVVAGTATQAAF